MLMPVFFRFPRLWFDSQLKSCPFPDKLLGSADFFFLPSSLFIKHLHILPSVMGILLSPCCRSLFWMTFSLLFCTTERHHHSGTRPTSPSKVIEELEPHSYFTAMYHELAGSLLPTTLPETDWWSLYPDHCPHPFLLAADCHGSRIREHKPGQCGRCQSCTFPAAFFYL